MLMYREPGVVISEEQNPSLIQATGGFNVTAIVGPGTTTILVENIEIVRGVGSSDIIPGTSSGQVTSIVGVGDAPGFFNYKNPDDFLQSDNYIDWSPVGTEPSAGASYYASYRIAKDSTYYEPIRYFDIDDVRKIHGSEVVNGNVNELSLAAYLAFKAEPTFIVAVQTLDGGTASYVSAIDKLKLEEVDTIVVTGITNSFVRNYVIDHCKLMSSDTEGRERTTFIAPSNLNETVSVIAGLSAAVKSDRVCNIAPPSIGVTITDAGTGQSARVVVSSIFAGANLSGIESNPDNDPATPLLRKTLTPEIDLNNFKYLLKEKKFLAQNGTFVLEQNDAGIVRVFDALTTDRTAFDTEERSIRRIKDRVRKEMRKQLEARYVGQKLLPGVFNNVQKSTERLLDNFVDSKVINAYRNVKATQGDPNEVKLRFEIAPVFPLKYITITFSVYVQNPTA